MTGNSSGNLIENIIDSNIENIYCHFSFRRPKGKDYGIFAVAMYYDYEGKKLAARSIKKIKLWENKQFVSAIQSYENALNTIYSWQGQLKHRGVRKVWLVTDNSTLAGWIQNPRKNKAYTGYMMKAIENYKVGAPKEIMLGIGLCEVRDYEKSYKYCKEEFVVEEKQVITKDENTGAHVIDINGADVQYKTIYQIEKENPNKPEIVGIQ